MDGGQPRRRQKTRRKRPNLPRDPANEFDPATALTPAEKRARDRAQRAPTRWAGDKSRRLVVATLTAYGTTCHLCGRDGATSADHLIPRSKGGDNSLANLRPAHLDCNRRRGAMSLEQWNDKRRRGMVGMPKVAPSRDWFGKSG